MSMIRPELFELLGNETRLRILLALAMEKDVTIYRMSTMTFIQRKVLVKHVGMLEKAGLVLVEKAPNHGSVCRRCTLNMENRTVTALTEFFVSTGLIPEAPDFRVVALGRDGHMKTKLAIAPPITNTRQLNGDRIAHTCCGRSCPR